MMSALWGLTENQKIVLIGCVSVTVTRGEESFSPNYADIIYEWPPTSRAAKSILVLFLRLPASMTEEASFPGQVLPGVDRGACK